MTYATLADFLQPLVDRLRQDVTARKIKIGGEIRISRTNTPFSTKIIEQHLAGGAIRGGYPINQGESVTRTAVLDFDDHDGTFGWERLAAAAESVLTALETRGFAIHPFRSSGGAGIHAIMIWDTLQDAYSVRMALRSVLAAHGYEEGTAGVDKHQVEIFPKQDLVEPGRYGNQFWLPLAGAGASVPLDLILSLAETLPREYVLQGGWTWRASAPVPLLTRSARGQSRGTAARTAGPAGAGTQDLEELRMLLTWIRPALDGDHDFWVQIGMALHQETNGADEGFELWWEWSCRGSATEGTLEVARYKWDSFRNDKQYAVTKGTLKRFAGEQGWSGTSIDEFEDLESDVGIPMTDLPPAVDILDPRDHSAIARKLIAGRFTTKEGLVSLLRHNGDWYSYTDNCYAIRDPEAMRGLVRHYLDRSARRLLIMVGKGKDKKPAEQIVPFKPAMHEIAACVDALGAAVMREGLEPPCMLDGGQGLGGASDYLPLTDGLLHIPTRELHGHTPALFILNALPYGWGEAIEPVEWLRFIESVWPDDKESQQTLQEMFGYLLTGDTGKQKMFLIKGLPRSGKGTIGRVLRGLLGRANTIDTSFSQLAASPFGLEGLVGKLVAFLPEARNTGGRHANLQLAVERMLSISGEDDVSVDRKHRTPWMGKLGVRFVLLANEVPGLGDSTEAFASRFIVLKTNGTWLGREDEGLTNRLLMELPGILRWALEGRDRLAARGYFVQPAASKVVMEELADANNPTRVFLRECCEVGAGFEEDKDNLYYAYSSWCTSEGRSADIRPRFFANLKSIDDRLSSFRPRVGIRDNRKYMVNNIRLLTSKLKPDMGFENLADDVESVTDII